MIGTLPMCDLAPLDYRYALDATMPTLAGHTVQVYCNVPALEGEIRQRLPRQATVNAVTAALWVEPLVSTWAAEIDTLTRQLPAGAPLVVVASRPLARLLPERRSWNGRPLCMGLGGVCRLRHALALAGFRVAAVHGIHSLYAIALNILSRQIERRGRPDGGDRLHFAARLHYRAPSPLAAMSTVALLFAHKGAADGHG